MEARLHVVRHRVWHRRRQERTCLAAHARRNEDFDSVLAQNPRLLVGSPRTVKNDFDACLERLADRPSFSFAPAIQWGDRTHADSLETMQLCADQVHMPA